ncbi:hypothetical protein C7C46_08855 [Streptomyces tateyamensis]|uniref:Uncharacterized protein n=1 Tax=Streptomyces tateyamensis TaxID=565073 RepID=A0A2V4P1J0_9ACTN|nr:hypothetical protein [Streptomyces tateyamensis]PYC83434.1 hypothetical protein C7C46_08855 [Streptomyces tateyamensis]
MRSTLPATDAVFLFAEAAHASDPRTSIRLQGAAGALFAFAANDGDLTQVVAYAATDTPWQANLHPADLPLVQAWLGRLANYDQVRIGTAPSGTGTSITLRCGHRMLRVVNPGPPAADTPSQPQCGACRRPFDPNDRRWNGRAQHGDSPWCRSCIDRCHDNASADHRCLICH